MKRNQRGYRRSKKFRSEYFDRKFIKYLSISITILLVLLLCVAIFYHIYQSTKHQQFLAEVDKSIETSSEIEDIEVAPQEKDITFTLTAVGNIMNQDYDFSYLFKDIDRYLKTTDIAIGNLETTLVNSDDLPYQLKKFGINVLTTANDHCLDRGLDGLSSTIDVLDDADIAHFGTNQSQEARNKVLFKYVKGIKIAFISYTYGITGNKIPSNQNFCVNQIDKEQIKQDIDVAKSGGADMIVAYMHWGSERQTAVTKEQKDLTDFLFQNGVDVILGSHPYHLQPMEKRTITLEDGSQKEGFVIYSLGNFISNQNSDNFRTSIILNLKITRHLDGNFSFDSTNYVPIYMDKNDSLLDLKKAIYHYEAGIDSSIGKKTYQKFKLQLENIQKIIG